MNCPHVTCNYLDHLHQSHRCLLDYILPQHIVLRGPLQPSMHLLFQHTALNYLMFPNVYYYRPRTDPPSHRYYT